MHNTTNYTEFEVFIIRNGEIEAMTLSEFLCEFYSEEVTSPRGIMPKLFVQETEDGFEIRRWEGSQHKYYSGPYATEEDAMNDVYECWENNYNAGEHGNESYYLTEAEAERILKGEEA